MVNAPVFQSAIRAGTRPKDQQTPVPRDGHIWEGGWAVLRGPVLGAATAECEQRLNARI